MVFEEKNVKLKDDVLIISLLYKRICIKIGNLMMKRINCDYKIIYASIYIG